MSSQAQEGAAGGSASALLAPRYRTWLVTVLLVLATLNFADRAILSVLAQPIKEDLGLSDSQLGVLQGLAFAILYSLLGIPIGWLAERVSRKNLLAVCVGAWSFMTAFCGMAGSFFTLLLGRIGVGIGEAGFQPAMASLVSDHFKPDRRASIIGIILLGSPLGFLVGQSVGGWVTSEWGWRTAFYALGAPGLLIGAITWLTLREPPRGLAEGKVTTTPPPTLKATFAALWAKPTFRHLLAGFVVAGFAMNAIAQFVLPFYLRGFGLPIATVGVVFGVIAFSSNGLGMLLGGVGLDRLSRRDPRWPLWGPALMLTLAAPLYLGAFASPVVWVSLAFIWFANLSLATHLAPSLASVQNVTDPRMRAMATALLGAALGLLGSGLGPTLLGVASDFFASHAFAAGDFIASCPGGRAVAGADSALDAACRSASTQGLKMALLCATLFLWWAAVHFLLASRTLRRDLVAAPART